MSVLEAIILGIIQGLTEFLPVSSSGHLEIVKVLFGNDSLESSPLAFTVLLHFATTLSTIVIFRKEIIKILKDLLKVRYNENTIFLIKIIVSMIPAVLVGLFFENELDALFRGRLTFVGSMLLVTAFLLYLADRSRDKNKKLTFSNALWIGLAQAVAILPGISRSGATIVFASLLGVDRRTAVKFSFLMVIPIIIGSMSKSVLDYGLSFEGLPVLSLVCGFIAAFGVGCLACKWMIFLVRRNRLIYFSVYCLLVGLAVIILNEI